MNQIIINEFQNLINLMYYEKPDNYSFKVTSFKKTIQIIENLDFEIKNINSIKNIKGIGKSTLERIDQIIKNGELKENKMIHNKDEFKKLLSVTGIGPAKAKQLLEKNETFDKLIKNYNTNENLTHHQKLGFKYYYDISKSIPYDVIKQVESYLATFDFEFNICGSFRRKKKTSGDIDVLIKKKNNSLKMIINMLSKKKFLIDHLTECGETKYMGICKINNSQFMRIDIRLISEESYPYALLYFTGSKKTNTMMRNQAIKLGFKLNEYCLYDKHGEPIYFDSEHYIFECLNLKYIEPENR